MGLAGYSCPAPATHLVTDCRGAAQPVEPPLAAATAGAIALGIEHLPAPPDRVLVAGGGRHNPGLIELIAGVLDCPVEPVEAFDLDGDMLEAQAFAYLAVRVLRGLPTSGPGTTGVAAPVGGGQISRSSKMSGFDPSIG